MFKLLRSVVLLFPVIALLSNGCTREHGQVPGDIRAIFAKPAYQHATWGLRVTDMDTGEVIYDLNPDHHFLIGSVRKLLSVGLLLNAVGSRHTFVTPVHRQGIVRRGVLTGNLILVASGDLTMGGRRNPDGSVAIANLDHNEANDLGNAQLTAPDPLAGYRALAQQIAASGIKEVQGDVIIDDRLFVPFRFRGQFDVRPIFVNDDAVDVTITPTAPGAPASVQWRPASSAFGVMSTLTTSPAGSAVRVELEPELPTCIGVPNCVAKVSGQIPADFVPPLTSAFPLVRTFRIVEPARYARTGLIEALKNAGVTVKANAVGPNRVELLPPPNSYAPDTKVAELVSVPYADIARFILKVSYNIGADTALVLFGLTRGVKDMRGSLDAERKVLSADFGIRAEDFTFVDGSGGGLTTATTKVVTTFLERMSRTPDFAGYHAALPILGIDGSLASVSEFKRQPSLAGAERHVFAKTGTFVEGTAAGPVLRAKALAGYIQTKSGRRLAFAIVVNDAGVLSSVDELFRAVQDQGTIAAILWRDH
ncbi:MAG TPA: D-alanyl-D-alanine carboxypeptidase [bacterium]|jgi:D-alanyl-D-alanine carboxypeptidase/D-alanyl-D-alanine-endopeptidase (penicillin-binding protein 4)